MDNQNKNSPQLFYIEDDLILAEVTTLAFKRRGWQVTHTENIALAEKRIAEETFSHALLDLKVNDGHTLPLVSQLINAHPKINIVVLTGYASIATAVQAVKLGANNYLSKPADINDILLAFEEIPAEEIEPDTETNTMSVKRLEWEHIQKTLSENQGNISATARKLNMHRRTLQRKLLKKPVSV